MHLQRRLRCVAAFEFGEGDGAAAGVEGFGFERGVEFEVLRGAGCGRPAHGDGGVAGPDALDVGAAAGVAVEFDVVDAAVVGEGGGLPRCELDAGAIGDGVGVRGLRAGGGAGGEGDGECGDGDQRAHAWFPEEVKPNLVNSV